MEGLLSFLIFGGLFFLMMRYGCGAHMVHGGHGGHSSHGTGNEAKHIDPVCGMDVDMSQGYGWFFALVWVPIYNFFAARVKFSG